MPNNITDLSTYKHNKSVEQAKNCLSRIVDLPLGWNFRPRVLNFMRAHSISAPDLLHILKTATKVDFSDESAIIVTGQVVDGAEFSLIIVVYPDAMAVKVLKMWNGSQSIQQIA